MNDSPSHRRSFSLRSLFVWITVIALIAGNAITLTRLRTAQSELDRLRRETGYLGTTTSGQLAAVRVPCDEPLTYRFRVRVPGTEPYRLAYSTVLPKGRTVPDWYSAIAVSPGESIVTIRIAEDPRDQLWKISTLVRGTIVDRSLSESGPRGADTGGTRRMGTVLPESHTAVFRASHDVISTGVPRQTVRVDGGKSLRLLDDRWIVGDQALLLFGDRAPDVDQIGVYAELQSPDQSI